MRSCGYCKGDLEHINGEEVESSDYRGNSTSRDIFKCQNCHKQYYHVYRERFNGDSEYWEVMIDGKWQGLSRKHWPTTLYSYPVEKSDFSVKEIFEVIYVLLFILLLGSGFIFLIYVIINDVFE
jgi:hypothetical protein